MRPTLNDIDKEILFSYYKARRDLKPGDKMSNKRVKKAAKDCLFEKDFAEWILKIVDDFYSQIFAEKVKIERASK